jgi:polyisoprenyl-teichoic acid--peptidoglycan teichoic acid transferase
MANLTVRLVGYNGSKLIMRTSKKHAKAESHDDKDFERLYRTIPAHHHSNATAHEAVPLGEEQKPPTPKWKKVFKRTLIVIVIILALSGLWLGWKFVSNGVKIFGWQGLWDLFRTTKLKGEDEGRVNILLAGNSTDDPGHAGAELTDSIMVVSLNTKDKTGYILSIPRDLYIDVPGSGYSKINEAYQDGKKNNFTEPGYPQGGMGLLEKTVAQHFGLTLHYYALVNYTALQEAVEAVGGIQVSIQSTDSRGLYDPSLDLQTRQPLVNLPNGIVSLDGREALNLARARGNGKGSYGYGLADFTRTEHQRKILVALKDKASSAGTLSNPIKLGQLFDSMGNNVQTDLKAGEVRRLYNLSKEVPSSSIKSASLNSVDGKSLLKNYTTRSGQSALIPAAGVDDYTAIQAYLQTL